MNPHQALGPFRSRFFPIYDHELKKAFYLGSIFALLTFVYAVSRGFKDAETISKGGAELISMSKNFTVLAAVLYGIGYATLSKRLGQEKMFNIVVGSYFIFFLLFRLAHPYMDYLKPSSESIAYLTKSWPRLTLLWQAVASPMVLAFYIASELFSAYALNVAFWIVPNSTTSTEQAKRLYPVLMLAAAFATIAAGVILWLRLLSETSILTILTLGTLGALVTYNLLSRDMALNPANYHTEVQGPKKKKPSLSFIEAVKSLIASPYLLRIAIMVLAYGTSIVLFESLYKDALRVVGGEDENAKGIILSYKGLELLLIGLCSLLLLLTSSSSNKRRSWKISALLTPVCFLVGLILFLGFYLFGGRFSSLSTSSLYSPTQLLVFTALIVVVLIKAFKYTFFDPAKETAYIPLDEDAKIRGKAAVDGVGARLGKGASSFLITIFIVPYFHSVRAGMWAIVGLLLLIIGAWIWAVLDLSKRFETLNQRRNQQSNAR